MLVKLRSTTLRGIEAILVEVEVDVPGKMGNIHIVGLPDAAVRESIDRVMAALFNSHYFFPSDNRVVVNLAPADVKKEGPVLDLPIALCVLAATEQIRVNNLQDYVAVGELALDGAVRPVRGALSMTIKARDEGWKGILVPFDNAPEAAMVQGIEVYPVKALKDAVGFFTGEQPIPPVRINVEEMFAREAHPDLDFEDVRGQENAKRALEIAAAGGHNLLMIGPPGSGKTMLAQRVPTILPALTVEECLQVTRVHSIAGELGGKPVVRARPFRAPHHTVSHIAMVGGGNVPRPGEISLAHHGVLFLDELPEFQRATLEVLRQPLEAGEMVIDRSAYSVRFPARFMLIAAMNPCPCGFATDPRKACSCTPMAIQKYLGRVSGPLLDRIDIHLEVPAVPPVELQKKAKGEPSAAVAARVQAARAVQQRRFADTATTCNAAMSSREIERYCQLERASQTLLNQAMERLGLSARAYSRILKVARTIADLAGAERIGEAHVAEAVQYRSLDKHG